MRGSGVAALGPAAALAVAVAAGCVPATVETAPEPGREPVPGDSARAGDLPVPGRGTLRQDQFTVELRDGALRIKVTPLAEEVIRLAAPDTYQRLHRLATAWGPEARQEAGDPGAELFLVSFFSYQPGVSYDPESLQLTYRGRQMSARAIVPLSGGWGGEQLRQQETQNAVYAFEGDIDYGLAFVVRYGLVRSEGWIQVIPLLDRERSRVRSLGEKGPVG